MARCSRCGVDLHSCIQCVSFDTSARFECTQTTAARGRAEGRAQRLHAVRAAHDDRTPDRDAGRAGRTERPAGVRRFVQIVERSGSRFSGSRFERVGYGADCSGGSGTAARAFAAMTRPVRLLFFTQTLDCETCLQTRQILDELPLLSDKITIEEVNFVLESRQGEAVRHRSRAGDRDRRPGRIRRRARLEHPISRHAGGLRVHVADSGRAARRRRAVARCPPRASRCVAAGRSPVTMQVFTTPTCPHCPRAVSARARDGVRQPEHHGLSPSRPRSFPDLARRYHVTGVPKTVVDRDGSDPAIPATRSRFSARCRRTISWRRRSRPSVTIRRSITRFEADVEPFMRRRLWAIGPRWRAT